MTRALCEYSLRRIPWLPITIKRPAARISGNDLSKLSRYRTATSRNAKSIWTRVVGEDQRKLLKPAEKGRHGRYTFNFFTLSLRNAALLRLADQCEVVILIAYSVFEWTDFDSSRITILLLIQSLCKFGNIRFILIFLQLFTNLY